MGRIASVIAIVLLAAGALPAAAQTTLEAVKKRGHLLCGVDGTQPAFSLLTAAKEWEGMDVELCRAVAAAVLGDARKVRFQTTTALDRFERLAKGEFDILTQNSTATLQRVAGGAIRFAVVTYYDGQGFVVPRSLNVDRLSSLQRAKICVERGTTHELNMVAWFRARQIPVEAVAFASQDEMYAAYFAGRCLAVTSDATALAASIVASGKANDHLMLPDIISKEPLGPYVRQSDDQWLDIVRWTHFAMVQAEESAISQQSVDGDRLSADPLIQRLLGVTAGNGKALGLDERWAYRIVKQVGNYGEVYDRNVGRNSPLKFERGINGLWNHGGLMYAWPLR